MYDRTAEGNGVAVFPLALRHQYDRPTRHTSDQLVHAILDYSVEYFVGFRVDPFLRTPAVANAR